MRAYYERHYPQLNPRAAYVAWALDDKQDMFLPGMYTDTMLESSDKVLIIDAQNRDALLSIFKLKNFKRNNVFYFVLKIFLIKLQLKKII